MPYTNLLDIASLAIKWARDRGADSAEVFVQRRQGRRVDILANRISDTRYIDDVGIGVRVALGKKVGFSYTTSLSPEKVKEAIELAINQAKVSPADKYWEGLPEPSTQYTTPRDIYSSELADIDSKTLIDLVKEAIDFVRKEKNAILSRAGTSVFYEERAIANTNGVEVEDKGTHAIAVASTIIKSDTLTTPAIFEYTSSRVEKPDLLSAVKKSLERAKLCTSVSKLDKPGKYSVVFTPKAVAELFSSTIFYALRGDNVVRGRSPYHGKIGEEITSKYLTVIDDGLLVGGDNSWRFDGEGVATSRNVLVESGILRNFVFDTYWGKRIGLESTGNSVRRSYSQQPQPGYTNIVIEGGDSSLEDLLDGSVIVLYNLQGAHTANSDTGEYSVLANPGVIYKDGEPRGWLRGITVSGNIFEEVKKNISIVSREKEKAFPGIEAPWIRFDNIVVTPKA